MQKQEVQKQISEVFQITPRRNAASLRTPLEVCVWDICVHFGFPVTQLAATLHGVLFFLFLTLFVRQKLVTVLAKFTFIVPVIFRHSSVLHGL